MARLSYKSTMSQIEAGLEKFEKLRYQQMQTIAKQYALSILREAVNNYIMENPSLTGNTLNGFCCGAWYKGKLYHIWTVRNIPSAPKKATHGYTHPGDRGFKDYDSDEYIGSKEDPSVREYGDNDVAGIGYLEFQHVGSGNSENYAVKYLRSRHPGGTDWSFIIANATPYAEYLEQVRELDVLSSISREGVNIAAFESAASHVKKI